MATWIDERSASVEFASNGVKMTKPMRGHVCNLPPPEKRRKRSPMVGQFSRNSALNLRRKLACLPSEMFLLFGLTLTMPSSVYRDAADFKSLFSDFCSDVSGRIKGRRGTGYSNNIGFIWRVEVTTGENNEGGVRTPHLHCVVWTNAKSDVLQLSADWCSAVERHFGLSRGSLDPQVATQFTELTSCQAAFHYVANHTSKHKKGQLGFPGRQWGIYYGTRENRRRMSPILNRFDKKPISEIKEECELTEEQSKILAHGNTHNIVKVPSWHTPFPNP